MKTIFPYCLMVATILLGTLIIESNQVPTEDASSASPKKTPKIRDNVTLVSTTFSNDDPKLTWRTKPLSVLVIKKIKDTEVLHPFVNVIRWLIQDKGINVFVEDAVKLESGLQSIPEFNEVRNKLKSFQIKNDETDKIDLIICIGGHGTLLYTISLFLKTVPPVMPFFIGVPGFLTPLNIKYFEEEINNVLEGRATCFVRNRLECNLVKKDYSEPTKNFAVLNDVIIERGSNHLYKLDLYVDDDYITTVEGDGLVVSTPTGSSAFTASTGSSLVHPRIEAILISAICPQVLSFRSVLVPADVKVEVRLTPNTRTEFAKVGFDGANIQNLYVDDVVSIKTSMYPVITINSREKNMDWFSSLATLMGWNLRPKQKPFEENLVLKL